MTMLSRTAARAQKTRWVVGACTAWGPIYLVVFIAVVVSSVARGDETIGLWLFAVHGATMVLGFVLLAVYAVDIFKNPAVPEDRRVMWLILVVFASIGAMPAYWWIYMRAPSNSG